MGFTSPTDVSAMYGHIILIFIIVLGIYITTYSIGKMTDLISSNIECQCTDSEQDNINQNQDDHNSQRNKIDWEGYKWGRSRETPFFSLKGKSKRSS